MQAHKQHIEDNGFSETLANRLKRYPQAQKADRKRAGIGLIVPCCSLLAVWITSWLGGWDALFNALLKSMDASNPLTFILYVFIAITLMFLLILPVRFRDSV
jgi:Flp pilus assembly protein protease CpaA